MKPTISLVSGTTFNFLEPRPLSVFEVAHSLAKLCRFNGHCRRFYSVAQHSVLVSYLVPPQFAWQGLMHDAGEAVLGDITSPLKRLVPDYRAIEASCEAVIFDGFGLPPELDKLVGYFDLVALATEKRDIMPAHDVDMDWSALDGIPPSPTYIKPLGPDDALDLFMQRVHEISLFKT